MFGVPGGIVSSFGGQNKKWRLLILMLILFIPVGFRSDPQTILIQDVLNCLGSLH